MNVEHICIYIYTLRRICVCVFMQFMYAEYMRPSQSQSDEKPQRIHFGCGTTSVYHFALVV